MAATRAAAQKSIDTAIAALPKRGSPPPRNPVIIRPVSMAGYESEWSDYLEAVGQEYESARLVLVNSVIDTHLEAERRLYSRKGATREERLLHHDNLVWIGKDLLVAGNEELEQIVYQGKCCAGCGCDVPAWRLRGTRFILCVECKDDVAIGVPLQLRLLTD